METRVVTRVIIYDGSRVLLIKSRDNYWYPAGGGWEEGESLGGCAQREVFEETGQLVDLRGVMYVQEFHITPEKRNLELFFLAHPTADSQDDFFHPDTGADNKVKENRWFSQFDINNSQELIFPEFLKTKFWEDVNKINDKLDNFFIEFKQS